MKILSVERLGIPEVLAIRFARFTDERGYFAESYREGDFDAAPGLEALRGIRFVQTNESFSKKGVVRGLHFQRDPAQGKLVRVVRGHMIDLALDARRGSPTAGKIVARDMSARQDDQEGAWIWVPPWFAHGIVALEDTVLEYFCTAAWNPGGEVGISPLTEGLDWSLCDPALAERVNGVLAGVPLISAKDREGVPLKAWLADPRSEGFRAV